MHEAPDTKVGGEPEESKQELTADEVFSPAQADVESSPDLTASVITEQVEKLGIPIITSDHNPLVFLIKDNCFWQTLKILKVSPEVLPWLAHIFAHFRSHFE